MRSFIFAGVLLLVAGCASAPTGKAAEIVEADEAGVAGCKFLGAIYGKTYYGGAATNLAVNNAKTDALNKAAKLGATHIVYTVLHGGGANEQGHAEARAYKCEVKP